MNVLVRRMHWKASAPSLHAAFAPPLPRLPVPPLGATLQRLRTSLQPLAVDHSEYARASAAIDDFSSSETSVVLQERLVQRSKQTEHWLEEWWDDIAYMSYHGFDPHPVHLPQTPAHRAAALTRAALLFRARLRAGTLAPEATRDGPLCMDTYRWMFDCSRVPVEGCDHYVSHARPGSEGDGPHVVVFRKNRVWRVDPFVGGALLPLPDIERQFQHIYDNTTREYPGVGILTASNRDVWAKDYAELMRHPTNASVIHTIHSAAFAVALESASPAGPIEHSRALWHGTIASTPGGARVPLGLRNRWCDKPVQWVVFDNCAAGLMGEHGVMDGTPTARLCDEVLDEVADPAFAAGSSTPALPSSGSSASAPVPEPVPMDWEISPATAAALPVADAAASALADGQALAYHLTPYGKAAIKARKASPDAWAQLVVHLAFRRLLYKWALGPGATARPVDAADRDGWKARRRGGTYEAAATRRFFKGRTEALRVVTAEVDAWADAMEDPAASGTERRRRFAEAAKRHVELAKEAGAGAGVDRHLLGLKKSLQPGEPVPALFSDPLVQRSSTWILSTSAVFSKHFPVYGWGEVVPDGFGVAYMTGYDDRLQFTVTSRTELPAQAFCEEIARAAVDVLEMFNGTEGDKGKGGNAKSFL